MCSGLCRKKLNLVLGSPSDMHCILITLLTYIHIHTHIPILTCTARITCRRYSGNENHNKRYQILRHSAHPFHCPISPPRSSIPQHGDGTKSLPSSHHIQSVPPLHHPNVIEHHPLFEIQIRLFSFIDLSPLGKWSRLG